MRIIRTSDGVPHDVLGQLAWYNGYDNLTLHEIHAGIQVEMRPDHCQVYEFEMDQQSALLQMAFAGITVDVGKRGEMIRKTQAEKSKIESYMHRLLEAIGYYEYYRDIATLRFAATTGESSASLPRSWRQWLETPLTLRRQWKQAADAKTTQLFQRWLKELDEPFNLNSNTQKLRLFYHFFGIDTNEETNQRFQDFHPPWGRTKGLREYRTRSASGEYTPGVDRNTLEKLLHRASEDDSEAAYWAQPFLRLCLEHADLAKILQFLNCKLDQGVFYSSFGCVTETGRLSSKKSNYDNRGWNCFEPGAEALTPTGWKRLEEIKSGDLVMQWWPDGSMEWAPAEPVTTYYEGNLHCLVGEQMGMSVTDNHRMALGGHHRGPEFFEATAQELFKRKSPVRLQLSGVFKDGSQWSAPRLIAAYLADGTLENPNTCWWRCNLKKDRKINRIRELLLEDGLEWKEYKSSHLDIKLRFSFNIPNYYPTDWGPWIFDLTSESAEAILNELAFWDGSPRGKSHIFFTARYDRAVWIQTLAHICGRGATIVGQEQSAASRSDTYMYKINIKPRGWAVVSKENKILRPYNGPAYCLSVPSSYFLVRQHEKIAVTGNSQNVTPPLRIIFTSLRGQKSATPDYEQIESRMVAARCYLQFGAVRYLAATECGDLHSLACSMVWEDLPWPEDFTVEWTIKHGPFPKDMIKAAKRLAGMEAYRGKSRRDCSKTLGHGSNYFGKPANMAKQSHIDFGLVQHYQNVYFAIFPEIRQWHNWIIEQVQVHGEYSTIFGRPRRFFGRPSDDSTIREAIAHDGQSPAADYTNRAMVRLHQASLYGNLPAELFLQKHDELGMRYNEEDETEVTTKMIELMEEHFTLTAPDGSQRDWYVPAEMLVGWNLGHKSETNPDGLIELRGTDNRVRQRDPFAINFLGD
jgi:hypothetical protein